MNTPIARNACSRNLVTLLAGTVVVAGALLAQVQAAPRQSWGGLVPDFTTPIYGESFDEAYAASATNSQVALGQYVFDDSWSGYALRRCGSSVTPFVVPAIEPSTGQTNVSGTQGTIRFWFLPKTWVSASVAGGSGPGAISTLLELDAIAKNQSANVWSLQTSPDGTALSLVTQNDRNPTVLLQAPLAWQANQSHLIVFNYTQSKTELYLDGQLVEQGPGIPAVPPQVAYLFVGSSQAGSSVAGGDFDELYCFGPPPGSRFARALTPADVSFYYNVFAPMAALGPISDAEIAARNARVAANRAARLTSATTASTSFSLAGSGMSQNALSGGGDCPTNVPLCLTNVAAVPDTNGLMTVSFDVIGGTLGSTYDVYATTDLGSQWLWVTNSPTCSTVILPGQPPLQSFYMLRDGHLDSDGDGVPDYMDAAPFDPSIGVLSVFIDSPLNGSVLNQ
jgi:hypothetical protein